LLAEVGGGQTTTNRATGNDDEDDDRHNQLFWWRSACAISGILLLICSLGVAALAVVTNRSPSVATATATTPKRLVNNSKYKATQFISFTIDTLGGSADHGECVGRDIDPKTGLCYLGNAHNLSEDVHHRARIVQEVLLKLKNDVFHEAPKIDRNSIVLKIVMLPEFFWRGPYGACSIKELDQNGILLQVFDRLRQVMADEAFNDYLFVGGTIIAAEPADPNMNITQAIKDARNIVCYNFASVVKGGSNSHSHMVQKRYISGADFLSRTKLPNPSDEDLQIVPHNVLEIDGIRFGVEICLDHRMGQLYNNIQLYEQGQLVDVQLITSAGMAIERGPNPVVPGGVVYLSDGEASSAACLRTDDGTFDPDHVCRGKPDGIKHIPVDGAGYSNFFPLSACWDITETNDY